MRQGWQVVCVPKPRRYCDIAAHICGMLTIRCFSTCQVTKVSGHVTDAMAERCQVQSEHRLGHFEADAAADVRRLRQRETVVAACQGFNGTLRDWHAAAGRASIYDCCVP